MVHATHTFTQIPPLAHRVDDFASLDLDQVSAVYTMKDWQRSPEPEAMMGHRGVKRSRLSTPEDEQVAHAGTSTDDTMSLKGIPGPGPATQESRQALAAKAAEARATQGASRKARLMSLAEMSFRSE